MTTDVKTWAASAVPGERIVYYRGQPGELGELGESAREAADEGLVVLLQRRIVGSVFNYEAHRVSTFTKAWLEKLNARLSVEARWERSPSL